MRLRITATAVLAVALTAASCGGDGRDSSVGVATLVGDESEASGAPAATDSPVPAEATATAAGLQSAQHSVPTAPTATIDASVSSGGAEASGPQTSGTETPPASVVSGETLQGDPASGDGVQQDSAAEEPSGGDPGDGELSDEEMALEFAACMRENGLPDFEDPTVDADGNVAAARMFAGPGVQLNSEEFRQAVSACRRHIEGATFGQAGGGFNLTEIQDTLLGFARCLRLEGIEVDDPELSKLVTGGEQDLPRRLFGADFDVTDPAVLDAVAACRSELGGLAAAGTGG